MDNDTGGFSNLPVLTDRPPPWMWSALAHVGSPDSQAWRLVDKFISSGLWWQLSGLIWLALVLVLLAELWQEQPGVLDRSLLTYSVLERGIAASNWVAFASFYSQLPGLVGSRGLAPAQDLLNVWRGKVESSGGSWRRLTHSVCENPTLCWLLGASDTALCTICLAGGFFSALVVVSPVTLSPFFGTAIWWGLGLLYLSLITVSGDFLGLQSDSNVPEVDFVLGLLAPLGHGAHAGVAVLVVRFFAFRKMLACGICKYYGSPSWTHFTAMRSHYFTQPLPSAASFFAHHMPAEVHRLSVFATFVVEVLCPFLLWLPWPLRYAAWVAFNSLNAAINLTGNYGFIGLLNTAENIACTDDRLWALLLPRLREAAPTPLPMRMALWLLLATYASLSLLPLARAAKGTAELEGLWVLWPTPRLRLARLLARLQRWQRPFRLCNYQGKFSSMQTYRWESVLEVSFDGHEWRQCSFKYKPNGCNQRPVTLPFHLPRLDWRIWFLPHRAHRGEAPPQWFIALLKAVLEGREQVLALLGQPAPMAPAQPRYVRCRLEALTFAAWGNAEGAWWVSRPLGRPTPMDIVMQQPE